jgi:hypothetical protein
MANVADSVLQARTSFTATIDGVQVAFHKGDLVDADHPAVKKWPQSFGPLKVQHRSPKGGRIEQATAAPGEKRGS